VYLLLLFTLTEAVFLPGRACAATRSKSHRIHRPACSDHKDNDGDGLIDYPADPGCRSRFDRHEADPKRKPTPTPDPGVIVDGSLSGRQLFPADNPWNQDISGEPVDPNSDALIASIGLSTGLHPDFGTTWNGAPIGFDYVLVPGTEPKSEVAFDYADESDVGPYPIPSNPPIEGGAKSTGDRHVLMIDTDNWILYELFYVFRTGTGWKAGSGAIFDLNSDALRPAGWTSADAAGLPIFPGLVRYDDVIEQGEITHALRFTAVHSRHAYVYPARHYASNLTSASLPPMGMRVRLKADYDISGFPAPVQVILRALKKYGMFLADNGSNWFISGAHDPRWNDDVLSSIRAVQGKDFEVVQMGEIVTQ
jgi:hypothetical protein